MDLSDAIGNTPLVELKNINPKKPKVKIFCKLESCNPGGSVKDRPVMYMIKKAEEKGLLDKSKIILEATSGNTGIALAMIGASRRYRVKLFMPECVSRERRIILQAFGAEVVLTPEEEGTDEAIRSVNQIYQENPAKYYVPNQFGNDDNALAHYLTTGPEIFQQTHGKIDIFVAGMGTTGTLMGTGRYLKEKNPGIRIIGVEPQKGHRIQGLKNMEESIPPKIYDPDLLDTKITITDDEAFDVSRKLVTKEGIFSGMSSGAAVAAALKVAGEIDFGNIVVILPDRGERYLSTTFFRSICAKCPP